MNKNAALKLTRLLIITLVVSLLANLALGGVIFKIKKDRIIEVSNLVLDKFFRLTYSDKNIQQMLEEMNRTKLAVSIDGKIETGSSKVIKILILGNSLSYHLSVEDSEWDHASGMAASDINSDYVHLLMTDISKAKNVSIVFKVINLVDFERNYKTYDLKKISTFVNFQPDITLFQLGDNARLESTEDIESFSSYYQKLVSLFGSSKRIIATTYFPSKNKNKAIESVARSTNSFVVDLSHLTLLDKANFAKSEKNYSNKSIGMHPGNIGMRNIANEFFLTLNLVAD